MARFKGVVKNCVRCGSEFRVSPSRADSAKACSHKCAISVRARNIERKVTKVCKGCGEDFLVPRSHAGRRVYCCRTCMEASPAIRGVKASRTGDKNPSWTGGRVFHSSGYIYVTVPGHPFASKGTNYILEHRLLMEQHLVETDPESPFLILVDGMQCLSPKIVVHHKDEDKGHNEISNLECMTQAQHRAHHNAEIKKALAFYRKYHPLTQRGK